MEHLPFPSWQSFCLDALKEFDPAKLRELVSVAEAAVLRRTREIGQLKDTDEEKLALRDAWNSLSFLKGLFIAKR